MKRVLRGRTDYQTTWLRNQLTSLVLYESIAATQARAALLVPFANHFFNQVRKADLAAKKQAHHLLLDSQAVAKLFEEILGRFKDTETTFVRHYKLSNRRGDNAPMAQVMLTKTLTVKPEKAEPAEKSPSKIK
jgi:large subunit ribosomal protein L17